MSTLTGSCSELTSKMYRSPRRLPHLYSGLSKRSATTFSSLDTKWSGPTLPEVAMAWVYRCSSSACLCCSFTYCSLSRSRCCWSLAASSGGGKGGSGRGGGKGRRERERIEGRKEGKRGEGGREGGKGREREKRRMGTWNIMFWKPFLLVSYIIVCDRYRMFHWLCVQG